MKKVNYFLIGGLIFLFSCKEKKAKNIVEEFLMQLNDEKENLNNELMTENYANFFKDKSYFSIEKWDLILKPESDSVIIVESKGLTSNNFGYKIEATQIFSLINKYGGWKIDNSYNLVVNELDFEVIDKKWDSYWDKDKDDILKGLRSNIKLKILSSEHPVYFPDSRKGYLKLINSSNYDIKGIKILIEHFDRDGKSVNTDSEYISGIIRKHGYREFDWYTSDCSKCQRQKFKISFTKNEN